MSITGRLWIRVITTDLHTIKNLLKNHEISIFRSTYTYDGNGNHFIDAYVPKNFMKKIPQGLHVKILGDVDKSVKNASRFVSKTNRYKK